jgi:hypothetical protein
LFRQRNPSPQFRQQGRLQNECGSRGIAVIYVISVQVKEVEHAQTTTSMLHHRSSAWPDFLDNKNSLARVRIEKARAHNA